GPPGGSPRGRRRTAGRRSCPGTRACPGGRGRGRRRRARAPASRVGLRQHVQPAPEVGPAVDLQQLAGDERARGPGEERHELGHVLGRGGPAHRRRLLDEVAQHVLARLVAQGVRSEEHTSELQSRENLVCRLLLEKKKNKEKAKKVLLARRVSINSR